MSGSGNDFIFVDARTQAAGSLDSEPVIRALCARGTGVGADGIVFLEPSKTASVRVRYLNSDGSLAALCGNASLCATRLFVELGGAKAGEAFSLETPAGVLAAVFDAKSGPSVQMPAAAQVTPSAAHQLKAGERRAGFAQVGIPHLVIECDDIEAVDLANRGRELRFAPSYPEGTNVDFLAKVPDGRWAMRTYERGVEGETLACGTGAVASAVLLAAWGLSGPSGSRVLTRSGKELVIKLGDGQPGSRPWLAGEGRVVYRGRLAEA